jgi:hypothetical protein
MQLGVSRTNEVKYGVYLKWDMGSKKWDMGYSGCPTLIQRHFPLIQRHL